MRGYDAWQDHNAIIALSRSVQRNCFWSADTGGTVVKSRPIHSYRAPI